MKRLGRAKVIVVNIIFYISIYHKEFMIFIPIKEDFAEKLKIKKIGREKFISLCLPTIFLVFIEGRYF